MGEVSKCRLFISETEGLLPVGTLCKKARHPSCNTYTVADYPNKLLQEIQGHAPMIPWSGAVAAFNHLWWKPPAGDL